MTEIKKKNYQQQKEDKRLHSACFPELNIHLGRYTLSNLLKALPKDLNLSYRTISEKLREVEPDTPIQYRGGSFVKCRTF